MLGHRLERKGYNKTQSRREDKICIAVQQRRHHKDSGRCQVQRFLHEFSSQMGEEIKRRSRGRTQEEEKYELHRRGKEGHRKKNTER